VLEVKDLKVAAENGPVILDGVSLDVEEGEIVAVVGPNGSGKSTLAKTIMGCSGYEVLEGDVLLDGESVIDLPIHERARRGLTLAWQDPARFEGLTVGEYVSVGAKDEEWAKECLYRVGLDPKEYWDRECGENLSGGERKRVELAAVMAMKPRVAVLDEPDAGIDMASMKDLGEIIKTIKDEGAAVLLITHNRDLVEDVADRAYLMLKGEIVDEGDPKRVVQHCLVCGGTEPCPVD